MGEQRHVAGHLLAKGEGGQSLAATELWSLPVRRTRSRDWPPWAARCSISMSESSPRQSVSHPARQRGLELPCLWASALVATNPAIAKAAQNPAYARTNPSTKAIKLFGHRSRSRRIMSILLFPAGSLDNAANPSFQAYAARFTRQYGDSPLLCLESHRRLDRRIPLRLEKALWR